MSRADLAWRAYALVAAALALVAIGGWLWAIAMGGPILYGEGAVAHAALLARDRLEYTSGAGIGDVAPLFTAANYPPLYFHLAGIGEPFVTGRVISAAAGFFVAGAIAWRARAAGWLAALTLALAWLGSAPVLQWGSAVKPDLLALGLTVAAVVGLDRTRPRHGLAGALLGAAAMAKPTALLPAAAIFIFVSRRDLRGAARATVALVLAALAVAFVTHGPEGGALTHIVVWNQLPWRVELGSALVLVALLVLIVPLVTIALSRPSTTVVTAYAAGAVGILLLGGREGATINYFLDLSAAVALALAGRAPLIARGAAYPVAAIAQGLFTFALLNPFVGVPSLLQPTGKWGAPDRIAYVRGSMPGIVLIEDSGLLLANGREPIVDDLFLWSRLRASGRPFPEGDRVLDAVRGGVFDLVVTEVDLSNMDTAPGFERQRWHPDLIAAVLERYERRPPFVFGLCPGGVWCQQLFVYTRRSP